MNNRRRIEKWLRRADYENLIYCRNRGEWIVTIFYYKNKKRKKFRCSGMKPIHLFDNGRKKMWKIAGIETYAQYNEKRKEYHE